ncbi:MAG: hypothetical protein RLZZ517_218 [Candidatus Parcubacteria bacterium]|jgi:hypothetical protein
MKKSLILPLLITLPLFYSCTPVQKIDPRQELIYSYMPDTREVCQKYGQYGEYSYRIYKNGIEILPLSSELPVSYAEIWDTNHDGKLDSVWIIDHGKWRFSSLRKHPALVNDSDPMVLTNYLGLGNMIRNIEDGVPKGITPHKEE